MNLSLYYTSYTTLLSSFQNSARRKIRSLKLGGLIVNIYKKVYHILLIHSRRRIGTALGKGLGQAPNNGMLETSLITFSIIDKEGIKSDLENFSYLGGGDE